MRRTPKLLPLIFAVAVLTAFDGTVLAGAGDRDDSKGPTDRAGSGKEQGANTPGDVRDAKPVNKDDPYWRELDAEMAKAYEALLPEDVRNNRREPTDEEKLRGHFALFITLGTGTSPERLKEAERNREAGKARMDALAKAKGKLAEVMRGAPEATRAEAQKALAAMTELVKVYNEIMDPPAKPGASDREIAEATLQRIKALPRNTRRVIMLGAEAVYRGERLKILQELDKLRKRHGEATDDAQRKALEGRIAAYEALLAATDAKYEAEKHVYEATPLGELSGIAEEKSSD